MSLVFFDGFDYYESIGSDLRNGPFTRKWGQITYSGAEVPTSQSGRYGGFCLNMGASATVTTPVLGSQQTWIVGFAFKMANPSTVDYNILQFMDDGSIQCTLRTNGNQQLFLINGLSGAGQATGTTVIRRDTWYYIEVKVSIDNTNGSIHVKINERDEIHSSGFPVTGLNTQVTANATANKVRFSAGNTSSVCIDDFYVLNTITNSPGPANNDFLGDIKVETLYANGAGFHTDWTPLSGSNFSNVDDTVTDDDTTYVFSNTATNIDTYTFANLAEIDSGVKGVQVNIMHRKTGSENRAIRPVIRHSGTDYTGNTLAVFDNYAELSQIYQANPGTSTTWTTSDIDNAEFGVELVS